MVIKSGDFIQVGRHKGVVEEIYINNQISYIIHNGIKPVSKICQLNQIKKRLTKEEFLAYIKKTGHTALKEYI